MPAAGRTLATRPRDILWMVFSNKETYCESRRIHTPVVATVARRRSQETQKPEYRYRGAGYRQLPRRSALQAEHAVQRGRAARIQAEARRSRLLDQRAELPRQPAAPRFRARPSRPGCQRQDHPPGGKAEIG